MTTEIGSEMDAMYKEPVKDIVSEWKTLVDIRQNDGKFFSMFWIAGPDEKTKPAIDYITRQLGIDKNAVIEFEIDSNQWDVTRDLGQSVNKIRSMNGNRVLMIARGFEKVLANTTDTYRLNRAGHDWDQDVLEHHEKTGWSKPYSEINKHVVIITTIGLSAGQEAYDKAVKSAVGSQFRNGVIKLN